MVLHSGESPHVASPTLTLALGHFGRYVAPVFRRDRDVVLAAVRSCGQALKFIEDERLKLGSGT